MEIKRDRYLNRLIRKSGNGLIKIITGVRRCGKSYLLFNLYHSYLNSIGVDDDCIIEISLDDDINARYRNPLELSEFIRNSISDKDKQYYIFLDEIQHVRDIKNPWLDDPEEKIGFVDVLLGLMKLKNADIYVTGSNSRMLSSEIVTQFRDRGDEIRLNPLTFREFYDAYMIRFAENQDQNQTDTTGIKRNQIYQSRNSVDFREIWREYYTYGGLPRILSLSGHKEKSDYLQNLFADTYIKDVLERHRIRNEKEVLDDLIRVVSSSVGSLTNPKKISDTFKTVKKTSISSSTISAYLEYFEEAFLLEEALRYDIKGRKYIGTPLKYYFTDIGLRNACLNFRQTEESHLMENIIYNELRVRGFNVSVGYVEVREKNPETGKEFRSYPEIDFVATFGDRTYYIQSALNIDSDEKKKQEMNSLIRIPDSFKKIVVVRDYVMPHYDDFGIYYVGIEEFLLDETILS